MELIASIKGALAWFGGALAALTALCYGAGYFAYHAQLTMLGLNGTVSFPHDQMLLEGSQFLLGLSTELLRDCFLTIVVGVVAGLIWLTLMRFGPITRAAEQIRLSSAQRWHLAGERRAWLASVAVLLPCMALLVVHYDGYFDAMIRLGNVRHLLFDPVMPVPCDRLYATDPAMVDRVVAGLIVRGEACRDVLQDEFRWLVQGYFLLLIAVGTLMGKAGSHVAEPGRTVAKFGLGFYTAIYTLSLPIAYGVLVRAPIYPIAEVAMADGTAIHGRVLAQESDGLLLWRGDDRSATWYPENKVDRIRVIQAGSIFEAKEATR